MIEVSPVPESKKYRLLKSYRFAWGGRIYEVPAGMEFDGASVPRALWRVVTPFEPRVMRAALCHDYLYATGKLSKKSADNLFLHFLLQDGVPKALAVMMHKAVHLFGGAFYAG